MSLIRYLSFLPSDEQLKKHNVPSPFVLDNDTPTPPAVSKSRIALSFIGIILGIFLSFIIVGLSPVAKPNESDPPAETSVSNTMDAAKKNVDPGFKNVPWSDLWKIGIISLVICGLTYQGLYTTLKLYANEPGFLTFFVAFQYGFFWQSVIKGAGVLIT